MAARRVPWQNPRFSGDPARRTGNNAATYRAVGDLQGYELFRLGGSSVSGTNRPGGTFWISANVSFRVVSFYKTGENPRFL